MSDEIYTLTDAPHGRILYLTTGRRPPGSPRRLELVHASDGTKAGNWSNTDCLTLLFDQHEEGFARGIDAAVWDCLINVRAQRTRSRAYVRLLREVVRVFVRDFGWTLTREDELLLKDISDHHDRARIPRRPRLRIVPA